MMAIMKQSPMFMHALESFEHGLEHYLDGSEKGRKFALLHIDQAIELLLKEKVVQVGKSIYKTDGTTLSIHETFNSLKDLKLSERPRLEELHDLRNTIQHKGLTPDASSTQFYVEISYEFFKRFLNDELSVDCNTCLSPKHRALMEGHLPDVSTDAKASFESAQRAQSPLEMILGGYGALSLAARNLDSDHSDNPSIRRAFRNISTAKGLKAEPITKRLNVVHSLRNRVVHSAYVATMDEALAFLDTIRELLQFSGALEWGNAVNGIRRETEVP
jgi:hypothetical protein